jgi:hypothetical protein
MVMAGGFAKGRPMTPEDHAAIRDWMIQQQPDLIAEGCPRCHREVPQWGIRLLPFPEPNIAPLLLLACPLCAHVLLFDSLQAGVRAFRPSTSAAPPPPADTGSE